MLWFSRMEKHDDTQDEQRDEKAAIGGTTASDEKEQRELPPRGRAREGDGTHGRNRHDAR